MTIPTSPISHSSLLSFSGSGCTYSSSYGWCWPTVSPLCLGEAVYSSQCLRSNQTGSVHSWNKISDSFFPCYLTEEYLQGMWERQRTILMCPSHSFRSLFEDFEPSFSCYKMLAVFLVKTEVSWWEGCLQNFLANVTMSSLRIGELFCFPLIFFEIAPFQVLCKLDTHFFHR